MYKNQLQELAQRSCFNMPVYGCIREGPDHGPRFKATVNFNGEIFESPTFCTTIRQAEHAAAEVALRLLSEKGPSRALAAKVLMETGTYKNLLQETAQRAGLNLPVYTTIRSGPFDVPVYSCTVEFAGMSFTGGPAKTKKQAQKNAAITAWSSLKQLPHLGSSSSSSSPSALMVFEANERQEQVIVPSTGANKSTQNNRQHGRQRPDPVTDPLGGGMSLYPVQYQGWVYSNFSPEMTLYQMWCQGQLSQTQSRLLTLPVAPTPPAPHILPFIQFRPIHSQYFPVRGQKLFHVIPEIAIPASGAPLYFSNRLMPVPVMRRCQVTIQEIQEQKAPWVEWLHADADPDCWKVNIVTNSPGLSPLQVPTPPVSENSHAELMIQETLQENKHKNGMSEPKIGLSSQLERNPTEQFERASDTWMDTGFKPRYANPSHVKSWLHNPHDFGSSLYELRPHHPPILSPGMARGFTPPLSETPKMIRTVSPAASSANPTPEYLNSQVPAPVTIRNIIPSYSTIRMSEEMNTSEMPFTSFMAPPVQIRSVVPVCLAPSARKMSDTSQEGLFSDGNMRTKEPKDMAATSSQFGQLLV